MTRSLIATSCNQNHYNLVGDLVASLHNVGVGTSEIGFIHVGDDTVPATIADRVDHIAHVSDREFLAAQPKGLPLAFLNIKPRLPDFFPGYDVYVWLDGDTWVQNPLGLAQLIEASRYADICLHPERDPSYDIGDGGWQYLHQTYTAIYGGEEAQRCSAFANINAGVFAAQASSRVWRLWGGALADVHDRARSSGEVVFSDQIPLHRLIVSGQVSFAPLRAVNNWLVLFAPPAINLQRRRLLAPSYPFEEINIVHLLGASKNARYGLPSGADTSFMYRDIKALFAAAG